MTRPHTPGPRWRAALVAAAAALSAAGAAPAAAHGTEADFVIVTRMPEAAGTLVQSLGERPAPGGLLVRLEIFRRTLEAAVIETRVSHVRCAGPAPGAGVPHMVARKVLPRRPRSFADAALFDLYADVHVRDAEGRIRRYHDLNGKQMRLLTERHKPHCPGI